MTDPAPEEDTKASLLKKWSIRIGGMAGLLVAIGSVVNSGGDLVKKVRHLPNSELEQLEEELFAKNFDKTPVVRQPVNIQVDKNTVEMVIAVFDTGDVFVRYGNQRRWLAFKPEKSSTSFLLRTAFAQNAPSSKPPVEASRQILKRDTLSGERIQVDVYELKRLQDTAPATARSFQVSEMRQSSSSFRPTSETVTRTFTADPGFRFTDAKFEILSGNKYQLLGPVKISEDGRRATVTFKLTSGPIYDQYRGWLQGTLNATQERVQ